MSWADLTYSLPQLYGLFLPYASYDFGGIIGKNTVHHYKTQWQMETFLLKLFTEVYPQDYLVLVLDGVGYHKTPLIRNLLLDYSDRVFVVWLPGYCPKLNLIERFWEHMKQVTFDSYYWGDSPSLEQAAHDFFKEHNENPESDFAISFRR